MYVVYISSGTNDDYKPLQVDRWLQVSVTEKRLAGGT